ncbi:MAG: divergent polysaccharide deacetylase family protein [Halorhodospira sp.]
MSSIRWLRALAAGLGLLLAAAAAGARSPMSWGDLPLPTPWPLQQAALIIDDLGDRRHAGLRSIELPAEVTLAVLPHTPYGHQLAERAQEAGREVMLHLPMQARRRIHPGPGALLLDMDEATVRRTVRQALEAVPGAAGVNNHMGSLLTRHPGHMRWLMEELAARDDLYFIDSRTSARTVAQRIAKEQGVANARRHVFLDPQRDPEVIAEQFEHFVAAAQQQGGVIAIGHPYPETLELLERELPRLQERGVAIVPVSELVTEPTNHPVEEGEGQP